MCKSCDHFVNDFLQAIIKCTFYELTSETVYLSECYNANGRNLCVLSVLNLMSKQTLKKLK